MGSFNHFPAIIQALTEGAKVGVRQVAADVTSDSAANCPVDTGATQASAYWVASDFSNYGQAVSAAEGCDDGREMLPEVDHPESQTEATIAFAAHNAIYIHDGTRSMAARPFLAEAAEGARDRVADKVGQAISAAINAVAGGGGE